MKMEKLSNPPQEDLDDHYNPHRQLAFEHLRAAGVPEPEAELQRIYESLMPSKEDYDLEVEQFREDFYDAVEVVEYLKFIEDKAGDNAEIYADLYDQGLTREGRRDVPDFPSGTLARTRPEFKPASYEEFTSRQDLLPEHMHEQAYAKSFEYASRFLDRKIR